jgi:hypothetical protein
LIEQLYATTLTRSPAEHDATPASSRNARTDPLAQESPLKLRVLRCSAKRGICGARGYAESWIGFGTEHRTVPSRSRMSCRSGATHNPASFNQERSRPARTGCAPAQAKLNSPILAAEPSAHTPTGGNCASERHSRSTVQAFCPAPLRVFQISTAGALAVIPAWGGGGEK